ncbi:MAG: hypothetical protein IJP66_06125, partial [Kiritimatiellae bacterium]|nr:hypothetical protein [Kiritimatiellia bacterium]
MIQPVDFNLSVPCCAPHARVGVRSHIACRVLPALAMSLGFAGAALLGSAALAADEETTPAPKGGRLSIGPNAYRGLFSTRRRVKEVAFPVRFSGGTEDLASGRLILNVLNSASNTVVSKEFRLPRHDVPERPWYSLPLDSRLPTGRYTIDAELVIPAHDGTGPTREKASASFEIVAPRFSQTLVDDDGTMLVNGAPFFPVGLAGVDPRRSHRLADTGFNALSAVPASAAARDEETGLLLGLDRAVGYGLRCFLAPPTEEGGRPEAFLDYYAAPDFGLNRHPAIALWDLTATVSGGSPDNRAADWLRSVDRDHPSYAAFPVLDVFANAAARVDVPAFDCPADLAGTLALCRRLEAEVLPHAPAFCVFPAERGRPASDIRAAALAALVHGVRGLFWKPAPDFIPEDDEAYAGVAAEVAALSAGLASPARRAFVTDNLHGLVCGTAANQRFLILVNTSDKRIEADFEVPELARVARVAQPFAAYEDTGEEVLVISDKDLEAPVIGDDMGMPVPALEDDLLVATDAEIAALAAAKKRAREKPKDPPPPP